MVDLKRTSQKSTQQLALNDLKVADKIVINTEHSQYQFRVLDPVHRTGLLSGGMLGNKSCAAMLLRSAGDAKDPVNGSVIKPNTKAVFLVEDKNASTAKHLYTSLIVKLKLLRDA